MVCNKDFDSSTTNDITINPLVFYYIIIFFIVLYTSIMVYICYYICHKTDFCCSSHKQRKLQDIDLQGYLDSRVI